VFVPPFRDPHNYRLDPLVMMGTESVGWAMHNRFVAEGKPGTAARREASYSAWFNGNVRTTGTFHNQIGILTEMHGGPRPAAPAHRSDLSRRAADMAFPALDRVFDHRRSCHPGSRLPVSG
jgi:hypothetical protein